MPTDYTALEFGWKGRLFGEQIDVDLGVESIEPGRRRARPRAVRIHRLATRFHPVSRRHSRAAWACTVCDAWQSRHVPIPGSRRVTKGLRADIQLLADAGILRGPITTWPISWPDIARDVSAAKEDRLDLATVGGAGARPSACAPGVVARIRGSRHPGQRRPTDPTLLRDFADTPREEGELAMRASWLTDHFAVNLQGSYVADPDDDKDARADGTYLGVNFGNFMLSAGYMERWWGPGWDGSLILSTNARPIPTVTLERNYTDPFKTHVARRGSGPGAPASPWERAESEDVPVPDVRFFAARVNFKPRPWLEFGLTRTAQWCGGDRPCDWDTFVDMVLGNDNQEVDGGISEEQPGNQMAGYDMRLRSPWRSLPLAFYTQWIGEDEAGGLPSKFIGQFGLETWGSLPVGGWRLRVEYTDTACNFSREAPNFDCAYRHPIYPQGYAYRGRIIGHSMDNDSRMYTLRRTADSHQRRCPRPHGPPGRDQSRRGRSRNQQRAARGRQCRIALLAGARRRQDQRRHRLQRPGPWAGIIHPRARFRELATRILMLRGFRVIAALMVLAGALPSTAQVPTAEQLELLRSMSPEDREALMEQLGIGGSVINDAASTRNDSSTRNRDGRTFESARQEERLRLDMQEREKALKPEDSLLIDIDFKKDKPARIESPGPGLPSITIPAEPAPIIEPTERLQLEALIQLVRSRNPYQLDSSGVLLLPGFAPIMLAGLDEDQATHRLSSVMAFIKLDVKVTKLPVRKAGVAGLKPFGYDLFKESSSTFAPVTDVPVPADYVIGPGDQLIVQLFGSQNRTLRLTVGPGRPHQLARARPDQRGRQHLRARGRGHRTARGSPDDRRACQRRDG